MRPQIGIQLYTVRDQLAQDFAGTIRRVAEAGYTGVETAFFDETIPLEDAKQELDANGLTVFSAHTELPLGEMRSSVLRMAAVLESPRIVWHGWPRTDVYDTLDSIRYLAEQLNEANRVAQAAGLTFGIHNHWWECEPIDGTYALKIFRDSTDPSLFFELDAYWAAFAGQDVPQVIADLGDRLHLLHLKDGPIARQQPMVALGTGKLDIPTILQAAGSTPEWVVVELDQVEGDIFPIITESHRYLTQQLQGQSSVPAE